MKNFLIAATMSSCLQLAGAATAGPSMTFLAVPATADGANHYDALVQSRRDSQMVIISRQSTSCGQRPTKPWFEQHGAILRVGYFLPDGGQQEGAKACTALGIFTFRGITDPATKAIADVKRIPVPSRGSPAVASGPKLVFLAAPATIRAVAGQPGVSNSAASGRRILVAKVPALCGDRPSDPSFDQKSGALHVNFEIAGPPAGAAGACVATAIYAFRDLPALTVDPIVHALPRRPAMPRPGDRVAVAPDEG